MLEALYLVPHGGIIVPGMEPNRNHAADHLNEAMKNIAKDIHQKKIDLIILSGPHGYVHPVDYLIYYHQVFQGFQIYRGDGYEQPTAKQFVFPGNLQVSQVLIQMLREAKIPASPLIHAETNFPMQLAWGETIPLSYIADENGPEVVIFSNPMAIGLTRGEEKSNAVDELFDTGRILEVLANSPMLKDRKVAVIISGDLSHKHDPEHEYGYHEDSQQFDDKAVEWCGDPSTEKLDKLLTLHETAASCGIYGIAILQGIMNASKNNWKNESRIYECPSYFGMVVSSWTKE